MELWGGSLYNYGNNYVYGNTQLGNAAADTLTIYPATIAWGAGGDSDFCIDVDTNDEDSANGLCWDHDAVVGEWVIDNPLAVCSGACAHTVGGTPGAGDIYAEADVSAEGNVLAGGYTQAGTMKTNEVQAISSLSLTGAAVKVGAPTCTYATAAGEVCAAGDVEVQGYLYAGGASGLTVANSISLSYAATEGCVGHTACWATAGVAGCCTDQPDSSGHCTCQAISP
jgi:hypothetical protein